MASVICLDAKMSFDDNGLFRHPDIRELRDPNEEDPAETEAAKFDLSYVHLDGNIGCMVNGAGLAMATMDIVKIYGAEPANFLDVGGGASTEKVAAAFRIMLVGQARQRRAHQHLRRHHAMRRARAGRRRSRQAGNLNVPLVVRMEGTNVVEGKKDSRRVRDQSDYRDRHGRRCADAARKVTEAIGVEEQHNEYSRRQEHQASSRRASPARPARSIRARARSTARRWSAGVVPGKGGTDFEGIPIFDTVEQARKATGCNATVIYVPPAFAADAILEAVAAGIELVICITEGVPVLDMVKVRRYMARQQKSA